MGEEEEAATEREEIRGLNLAQGKWLLPSAGEQLPSEGGMEPAAGGLSASGLHL